MGRTEKGIMLWMWCRCWKVGGVEGSVTSGRELRLLKGDDRKERGGWVFGGNDNDDDDCKKESEWLKKYRKRKRVNEEKEAEFVREMNKVTKREKEGKGQKKE